jgi:hypothetical protein
MKAPMSRLVIAAVVVFALGVSACAQEPGAVVRPEPCRDVLDRAAVAREIHQQIDLLDSALVICRDVEAFTEGLRLHPGAIAVTPATFIQRRCENPPDLTVARSLICQSVVPPVSSVPGDNAVQVYIGRTLDGRSVELRSDQVRFTDGRPAGIVEVVEVSTSRGCEGLAALYAQWIPMVALADRGDELSVYAQHTVNLMQSLGCDPPQDPSQPDEVDGEIEEEE